MSLSLNIIDVNFFLFLDELINAIENDIAFANRELDTNQCRQYLNHSFFYSSANSIDSS